MPRNFMKSVVTQQFVSLDRNFTSLWMGLSHNYLHFGMGAKKSSGMVEMTHTLQWSFFTAVATLRLTWVSALAIFLLLAALLAADI